MQGYKKFMRVMLRVNFAAITVFAMTYLIVVLLDMSLDLGWDLGWIEVLACVSILAAVLVLYLFGKVLFKIIDFGDL